MAAGDRSQLGSKIFESFYGVVDVFRVLDHLPSAAATRRSLTIILVSVRTLCTFPVRVRTIKSIAGPVTLAGVAVKVLTQTQLAHLMYCK